MDKSLTLSDYRSLAELRYQLRRFLYFSEQAARKKGLEPGQHQLMLALKGLPKGKRPYVGELAGRLQIQHHSAVELVNRLSSGGLVRRSRGALDRRQVLIYLTPKGEKLLGDLSLHHKAELHIQGPALVGALKHAVRSARNSRGNKAKAVSGKLRKAGHYVEI